jgi:hypothetical protein
MRDGSRVRRLLVLLVPICLGCATATPRFSQELATAFAQDDMRRLETDDVELYYPAAHREAAERVARRATECLRRFRELQRTERPRERALLFLTSANFNNAYVTGQAIGEPLHSVNPLQTSLELLHWYGLSGAAADDVSCHEMFHFAHFEQVEAFWKVVNTVVGPVVPSQIFLERWFTEGVAQYYEGRITRPVGRPNSPLYRGSFESFVASRGGSLSPGDLSTNQRELFPYSGAYLTSLPFVEWLVSTYGEDALWELMDRQGRAFFAPFAVSLRFNDVYGKALGDLVSAWSKSLERAHMERPRPPTQKVLRNALGQLARVAVHGPSGTIALVHSGPEQVPMLRILEKDGTVRAEQHLVRLFPTREWVQVGPVTMSGLSFTADGKFLFLMNEDLISRGDTRTQLWKLDASTGDVVQVWQDVGRAQGGAVMPNGKQYVFIDFVAGRSRLASFDLETARVTVLFEPPPAVAVSSPAVSADGTRLVFSQLDGNGWNLRLREADGTVRALTDDGAFNYGAKWIDETHVSVTRVADGRLQAHRLAVDSGRLERLTNAPFTMLDAWPTEGSVVFVNREGITWSIDRAPAEVLQVVKEGAVIAQADVPAAPDATTPPLAPPPFPDSPALKITDDHEYSGLDHLFVPQLRLPGALVLPRLNSDGSITWVTTLYASLSGKDRLGRHNWALNGSFNFPDRQWTASVEYVNQQLAPWQLGLFASRDAVTDPVAPGAFWTASISGSRTFFTVPLSFTARALVDETFDPGRPSILQKYFGPEVSASYSAGESTAYGGFQRLFAVSGTARAYPAAFGSDRNVFDLRGALSFAIPMPLSQRHSFVASIVGRGLPGSPAGALRVGGQAQGISIYQSQTSVDAPRGPGGYLPGSLAEAVRGYDDFTLRTEGVGIATARYRFNFIIDRGTSSILWLFPSFFVRQFDVEAFGSGALTVQGQWLRAAGGAASFRFNVMDVIPFSLTYQYAWRFDFARGGLHTVSLSLE